MFEFECTRSMVAGLIFFVVCGFIWVPITVKVMRYHKAKKMRVSLPNNFNFRKLRAE